MGYVEVHSRFWNRLELPPILTSVVSILLGNGIFLHLRRHEPPEPVQKPGSEPILATVKESVHPTI